MLEHLLSGEGVCRDGTSLVPLLLYYASCPLSCNLGRPCDIFLAFGRGSIPEAGPPLLDGGLAQLARAPALQAGGQRFESVILHIFPFCHGNTIFDILTQTRL